MSDVLVKGKSKENVLALFAAADKVGVPRDTIKAVNSGFLIPEEVHKALVGEKKPRRAATKKKATESSGANDKKEGED